MNLHMNYIHLGDALEYVRSLPDQCVNTVVSSPPYFGLRDYGVEGQWGLEDTPDQYQARMMQLFAEIRRVLRDDGTMWINLGDMYAGSRKGIGSDHGLLNTTDEHVAHTDWRKSGYAPKQLIGMAWRVAHGLQGFSVVRNATAVNWAEQLELAAEAGDWQAVQIVANRIRNASQLSAAVGQGWYLRDDIIWAKSNPMPESVKDRCTRAHEYIFLLSKREKYYFDGDAIREPGEYSHSRSFDWKANARPDPAKKGSAYSFARNTNTTPPPGQPPQHRSDRGFKEYSASRNKRDVWQASSRGIDAGHYATYPLELIRPCILAGCPEGGVVLDPFMGSGTTAVVAIEEGRNYIGSELNPEFRAIAHERIAAAHLRRRDILEARKQRNLFAKEESA